MTDRILIMTNDQSSTSARKLTPKRFFVAVGLGVVLFAIVFPLLKLAVYEFSGASEVRGAIGKKVEFIDPSITGKSYHGTLVDAGYRFNDKWGWFDLHVEVEGNGSISMGLSPYQLDQLMILD